MNNLKLDRAIIFFDAETTGVSTEESRIVELACIKYNVDGSTEEKTIVVNPGVPIPKEASDVHGFTDEMVADKPLFKRYAPAIREWFDGCDLAGFNSDLFDVPLLSNEFERAGLSGIDWNPSLLDMLKMYRLLFPNTLSDVYKRLTGYDLENAHSALADINATKAIADILVPMLKEKSESPITNTEQVDKFMQGDKRRFDIAGKMYKDSDDIVRWSFSKNINNPVLEDAGFLMWFMRQDFPKESKAKIIELQMTIKPGNTTVQ